MKEKTLYKKGLVLLASVAILGTSAISLVNPTSASAEENIAQAAPVAIKEQTLSNTKAALVRVATFEELETALKSPDVTEIRVTQNIKFTRNIFYVPIKDVTITGKNAKIQLDTDAYAIYGATSKVSTGTISFNQLNVVTNSTTGNLFQSATGWNVNASNINFDGSRLFSVPEGKLTFSGTNNIKSVKENARVHDLEFAKDSIYNGSASTANHSDYSIFQFGDSLVSPLSNGVVDVIGGAKVTLKNSPQSLANNTYSAFSGLVQRINVATGATLDIDSAGPAISFNAGKYTDGYPSVNLAETSIVNLNSRGGGNKSTISLQGVNARFNILKNASLNVTGSSTIGVVDSRYKGTSFNLTEPRRVSFTNRLANSKLFYASETMISAVNTTPIKAWNQIGGDYKEKEAESYQPTGYFQMIIGKYNSEITSLVGDLASTQFKMQNYGKIDIGAGAN